MTLVRPLMETLKKTHAHWAFNRRTKVIGNTLVRVLPNKATVLDVGCGDGTIDKIILSQKRDLELTGLETSPREKMPMKVLPYDGQSFPFPNRSFDIVMIIDTLHHTSHPEILLKEAQRVAKKFIVIKDHIANNKIEFWILKVMDWVGNRPHDVPLPYNYWSLAQWEQAWKSLKLKSVELNANLGLYPQPFNVIFERKLHFVAKLEVE